MGLEGPFRQEDLQARVEALRAERERLACELQARELAMLSEPSTGRRWSWGLFWLGVCAGLPAWVAFVVLLLMLGGEC